MKTSYKSRVVGSIVVLMLLVGLAVIVLHRKQPLPDGLAAGDQTHQVLSLPVLHEKNRTAWHARQSQQIDQAQAAAAERPAQPATPQPVQALKRVQPVAVAPVSQPKPTPKPVVASRKTPAHRVMLRVASFSSIHNAKVMRDHLSAAGYSPRIRPVRVHNKTWYRLSAGPFANAQQAHQAQQVIQHKWKIRAQLKALH
jgi:cell division septation protein DedD